MGNCIDGSWNLKARVERESGGEEGRESRDEGRGRTSALIVCNLDFEIRNMSALVSRNMSFAGSFLFFFVLLLLLWVRGSVGGCANKKRGSLTTKLHT
jgi:hypothetical protein